MAAQNPVRREEEETYTARFQALSTTTDWGAEFLDLCEHFWAHIDRAEGPSASVVDRFVTLLQDPQAFTLAQQVIPDFRPNATAQQRSRPKQQILIRLQHVQNYSSNTAQAMSQRFQQGEDLLMGEEELYAEAELYRASLLLYKGASLSDEEDQKVRNWLKSRPGRGETSGPAFPAWEALSRNPSQEQLRHLESDV